MPAIHNIENETTTRDASQPVPRVRTGNVGYGEKLASGEGVNLLDAARQSAELAVMLAAEGCIAVANVIRSLPWNQALALIRKAKGEGVRTIRQFGNWFPDNVLIGRGVPARDKKGNLLGSWRGRMVLRDGKGLYVAGERDPTTGLRPKVRLQAKDGNNIVSITRRDIKPVQPVDSSTRPGGSGCILKTKVREVHPGLFDVVGMGENQRPGMVALDAEILRDPFSLVVGEAHAERFRSVGLRVEKMPIGGSVVFHIRCDGSPKPSDTAIIELNEE